MTNDRYPPPSYAATIWLSGDVLMLALPEAGCVQLPLDRPHAVDALLAILRQRMARRSIAIGMPGAPVRNDVEKALESDEKYKAWLAAMAEDRETKAAQRQEAERTLAEIGL